MWVFDRRFPGHLRVADVGPVELAEPGVLLDVLAVVARAEPFGRVGVEKTEDDVLGAQREELGELNHALQDLLVDVLGLLVVVEGRIAGQQLVDEDSNAPVIHCLAVARLVCLLQHFRRKVLGRAADSEGAQVVQLLGKAEIDELGKPVGIDHDVFRFEVSEDDVSSVQVRDGVKHSCYVEHGGVIVESSVACESGEEFSALDVLKHHVDVLGVLEGGLAE